MRTFESWPKSVESLKFEEAGECSNRYGGRLCRGNDRQSKGGGNMGARSKGVHILNGGNLKKWNNWPNGNRKSRVGRDRKSANREVKGKLRRETNSNKAKRAMSQNEDRKELREGRINRYCKGQRMGSGRKGKCSK